MPDKEYEDLYNFVFSDDTNLNNLHIKLQPFLSAIQTTYNTFLHFYGDLYLLSRLLKIIRMQDQATIQSYIQETLILHIWLTL